MAHSIGQRRWSDDHIIILFGEVDGKIHCSLFIGGKLLYHHSFLSNSANAEISVCSSSIAEEIKAASDRLENPEDLLRAERRIMNGWFMTSGLPIQKCVGVNGLLLAKFSEALRGIIPFHPPSACILDKRRNSKPSTVPAVPAISAGSRLWDSVPSRIP